MPRIVPTPPSPKILLSHRPTPRLPLPPSTLRSRTPHSPPRAFSSSPISLTRRSIPSFASLFAAAMSGLSSTSDTSTTTTPSSSSVAAATPTTATTATNAKPLLKVNPLPRTSYPAQITFSPQDFQRADSSSDPQFYASPRFVQHIDDSAIASLKAYYAGVIPVADTGPVSAAVSAVVSASAVGSGGGSGGGGEGRIRVVDLCSSWTSHLPDELRGRMAACVGYGLNAKEMAANEHLTGWWVRDLNAPSTTRHSTTTSSTTSTSTSASPVGETQQEEAEKEESGLLREITSGTIDVVICNVSVDYLVEPLRVLGEVRRVLKAGGTAHMAFSNRCFPTKVIGRWLRMGDEERRRWVGGYFWAVGGFEDVEEVILKDGRDWNDPLFVVRARKG